MSSEGSAEWELSKENIQPLKKGRKVEKLAQDPRAIEAERQTYEANLRFYSGPDPLKPWYDYILWLEQTFPKGGSEGGLNTLLSKCMTEFKSKPECNQDPRYLEVWIKYANISSKPLDCYNFMYQEKLCTEIPGFYIAWANQLEESGQLKRAETVYKSAMSKEFTSEEKVALEQKHKQFQTRVAKKVMDDLANGSSSGASSESQSTAEEREALARLKGRGKKQVVGSLRVGKVKIGSGPGALIHPDSQEGNAAKPKFSILEENPPPEILLPSTNERRSVNNENLPCTPAQNRENDMGAGKWTSSGCVGKKSLAVPLNQIGTKPSFEIHQDGDMENPPLSTPCKIGGTPALSTKKKEKDTSVPVALFEPFDPSVRPMYCKHLIYQGLSEISFEELRAIPFIQKMKEEKAMEELVQLQKKTFEDVIKKQEQLYNEKLGMLQSEIAQMKERLNQSGSNKSVVASRHPVSESSRENSSSSKVYSSNDNTPLKIGDETKGYDGSSKESSQLNCNSPTVNTMNIIKSMWVSPSNQSKGKDPSLGAIHQEEFPVRKNMPFQVPTYRNDEEGIPSDNKKPPFEIFNDMESEQDELPERRPSPVQPIKPSFEIFEDPGDQNEGPPKKKESSLKAFEVFQDPEDVPKVAKNRFPGANALPSMPELGGETTMVVTSLEDFAEKAVVSSTPAFGKRFLPDDDENTCAVPLLFKKPVEPENLKTELQEPSRANTINAAGQDLYTILETSRENEYKSSSSSSSCSAYTTQGGLSSHFGSTLPTMEAGGVGAASETESKRLGSHFSSFGHVDKQLSSNETTGYAGDVNSTSKTPNPPPGKRPCHKDTPKFSIQSPEEDEDDDERFGEIMSNFERALEKRKDSENTSIMAEPKEQNSFFQQSFKPSFVMDRSAKFDSMFQSSSASFNMSSPQLDLSENSAAPQLDVSPQNESLRPQADESLNELTDKMKGVLVQSAVYDLANPFDEKIQRDILRNLERPLTGRPGFVSIEELIPKIYPNKMIKIKESFYGIKDLIGEGAYGKIFKAVRHNNNINDTICEMSLVFKVQKPAREWEFYICSEVQSRLQHYGSFMTIPRCYSFQDGSIFVSEYLPASLLDILNAKKMADETFAIFSVIELCEHVHRLGKARIIHADIKPDNIMLRRKPYLNKDAISPDEMFPSSKDPCIQLIDFGRSIDMSICEEGTTFTHVFKDTPIPEMIQGKPWSYQIDYFGIASTAYCLKFGSYMNLIQKNGRFTHGGHYKRWWNGELWTEFYEEFLNIDSASGLPDLIRWKKRFEDVLFKKNVASDFNRTFKEIEALGFNFF